MSESNLAASQTFPSFLDFLKIFPTEPNSLKRMVFDLFSEIVAEKPELPAAKYFDEVMQLLGHLRKNFITSRSPVLLKWLIETFCSLRQSSSSSTAVQVKRHFVQYEFYAKETISVLMPLKTELFDRKFFEEFAEQENWPFFVLKDVSFLHGSWQGGEVILYFEVQKHDHLFGESDIDFIVQDLPKLLLEEIDERGKVLVLPSNRELLIKSVAMAMRDMEQGDIPQVFIDLTKQTTRAFHFSVLICALSALGAPSFEEKLRETDFFVERVTEARSKTAVKEAITTSIELPFLPHISHIEARQKIGTILEKVIGPFRDANGGLLEQSEKAFTAFAKTCMSTTRRLKSFFHSITPQELQTTIASDLFLHAYNTLRQGGDISNTSPLLFCEEGGIFSICIKIESIIFLKGLAEIIRGRFEGAFFSTRELRGKKLTCCTLKAPPIKIAQLKKEIGAYLKSWLEQKEQKQVLRLVSDVPFTSFDPRIGTDEETSFLHRLLFAGLMQISSKGVAENGLAEKVQIFDGGQHYRFHLRTSCWSDGSPLQAQDFIYSWKSSLNPSFLSTFTQFFYPIRNAQKIKTGVLPADALGVQAPNPKTLDLFLDHPCPYFLELCAHPAFSPISINIDRRDPNWTNYQGKKYICNGGFTIDKVCDTGITLLKNPHYWNVGEKFLERIEIQFTTKGQGLKLFENGDVDALLSPLSRCNVSAIKGQKNQKKWEDTIETKYIFFNCQHPIFSNKKIRQAIAKVIDRSPLAQAYSTSSSPHFTPYSPYFTQLPSVNPLDIAGGQALLEEGLAECGQPLEALDRATLTVSLKNQKVADLLVQQVNEHLHLHWQVATLHPKNLFEAMTAGEIEMILYAWRDTILHPSYFLEIFSSAHNPVNSSFWSQREIKDIIEKIREQRSQKEIKRLHKKGEEILSRSTPCSPLFITPFHSVTHSSLDAPQEAKQFKVVQTYKK